MFDPQPSPNKLKDTWDIAAHVGNVIGLVGAAVWAYFNFVKSRTYHPRMELSVSGEIQSTPGRKLLAPRITLKNIGLSKVQLIQRGTGYRVWYATGRVKVGGHLAWLGGTPVYRIFETHEWLEPGESIFNENELHSLPMESVAAKIEVRLRAPIGLIHPRVTVWTCSTVVLPESKKEEHNGLAQ